MRQQKTSKKTPQKARVESVQALPAVTLETTAPAITAQDIRRIVAKLKGESQSA